MLFGSKLCIREEASTGRGCVLAALIPVSCVVDAVVSVCTVLRILFRIAALVSSIVCLRVNPSLQVRACVCVVCPEFNSPFAYHSRN